MTEHRGRAEPAGLRRPAGFRWPAEWEPHAATWLSWPHNAETWPGRLPDAEQAYAAMVAALQGRELVRINVADEPMEARARGVLEAAGVDPDAGVAFHRIATDDAWVRDCGPIFVVRGDGAQRERLALDFGFDSWGGKYPPWDRDDAVPRQVAQALGLPRCQADFVLEGGSIDGNGEGTVLTTESCLLNPNRSRGGPPRTREGMERRLREWLGIERVVWLGAGIEGDDTDGHVDDIARFVGPRTVLAAEEREVADPNAAPLAENLRRLREACDGGLEVVTLPMPPPVEVAGLRCPASYLNFYLANGVVLVPVFDVPSDGPALETLRAQLPGRVVVPIPSRALVVGLGAVHCATQQEPAALLPAGERG